MRSANKGVSIAVLTTAVLAMAACSSSGSVAASAAGTSAALSATSTSVAATTVSPIVTTSSSPSASPTAFSSPGGGAGGGTSTSLTAEQIRTLLLTDKDDPGYTYDASADDTSTKDTPDVVTSGGSICQTLADAMGALSTKYGTTVAVNRKLTDQTKGNMIITSVSVLPSVDKASAVISDLTAGLNGCKTLSWTPEDSQPVSIAFDGAILMGKDQAGSVAYISNGDKTLLMGIVEARVGTAVSVVALYEPETQDTTALHQMGATLTDLSDIQFQRLNGAEAVS
jgi:PknH-like protein